MELYLIRHAQSQNNALPEHLRVEDPALTPLGQRQAECLADRMSDIGLTRLFTSPFLRTLQTTEPIRLATGLVPEVRTYLHELGGCVAGYLPGEMIGRPGLTAGEIRQLFPSYRVEDVGEAGWWECKPYESHASAQTRALQIVKQAVEEFAGTSERVAYVMHADIKRLVLEQCHGKPLDIPYNTSVTKLAVGNTALRLELYNCVTHLPPELRSW